MKTVFADSDYWIALLNPQDQLHQQALDISNDISPVHIITSEMVCTEVLNYFGKRGQVLRMAAARLMKTIRNDLQVTVIAQSNMWFEAALRLYEHRQDKAWSHTDCSSILIMKKEGLVEVLSYDKHFMQAGLIPLLR
ncbi:MAG: type II toxin-antitoxin system VapC family toxin [Chloroflexi bacterium]|nr:type II toxin-antitoxin system VapC family toxin [Chloroflexota bacterium]